MLTVDIIYRVLRLYVYTVRQHYPDKTKEQIQTFKNMNKGIYIFLSFLLPLLNSKIKEDELQDILEIELD